VADDRATPGREVECLNARAAVSDAAAEHKEPFADECSCGVVERFWH